MALLPPDVIQNMQATLGTTVALGGLSLFFLREHDHSNGGYFNNLLPLPELPGLPVVGNLLQLKEKKPRKTFTKWAETYGPIYSIKTGSTSMVVLNSNHVAKEAMVTRFPSISTRKLSNALKILTLDKTMVVMSDYDEFHKMIKRHLLTNVLGPNAKEMNCYIDYLLFEAKTLTNQQMLMLRWETIIETSDTNSVTTEWAMYELAKDPKRQECLYHEIQSVFGSDKIS